MTNRNDISAKIKSFQRVVPMIYAYTTPDIPDHTGWTKIGYTEKKSVQERINEQTHTADVRTKLLWQDYAMYKNRYGVYFTDHDFHAYLERQKHVERKPNTEWFHIDGRLSQQYFNEFAGGSADIRTDYELRQEQLNAVRTTKEYFEHGGKEFLWNAKPRFGKTLSTYDLICQMGLRKVLIVTNRPSISNSWAEDFHRFIEWQHNLVFVSDAEALRGNAGVYTRDQYLDYIRSSNVNDVPGMVAFVSLQDLKGSLYFGGNYDKLRWIADNEFDLLVVDEAQEGVDTIRTERAFRYIKRNYTLYLSGTAFKAIASEQFAIDQIFNWSYADEQEAKNNWQGVGSNPYEALPQLALYTYQLSNMIYEEIQKGIVLSDDDEAVDYAFDLNEFFITKEDGKFVHEEEIKKFLHVLTTQEKYPFSTPELCKELSHTIWLLNRVASAKALAKLLKEDEVFKDYEIILAAGDGRLDEERQVLDSYNRVKEAIRTHEKTITLSVGQLTVGVTIPEWSGILMLCNLQSASSYFQAAFRTQNPCVITNENGQILRKETAYIFDFDPARTLVIYDEFANNLMLETAAGSGTTDDRKENIRRLLNFFPVLGEDDEGRMVELDAAKVLSIPRHLKCQEVVRHGFMSNFLFQNIGNVFGAPSVVRDILEKLVPAHEDPRKRDKEKLKDINNVPVDNEGKVDIPNEVIIGKTKDLFGPKIYEEIKAELQPQIESLGNDPAPDKVNSRVKRIANSLKKEITEKQINPIAEQYNMTEKAKGRMAKEVKNEIDKKFDEIKSKYEIQEKIAHAELDRKLNEAQNNEEREQAKQDYDNDMTKAVATLQEEVKREVDNTIDNNPRELEKKKATQDAEKDKNSVEDAIRAHLRGFARTIPSFIMAYGDGQLTLGNFDKYTEDDVFQEVTGITVDDFRFLRDGGYRQDPETGEKLYFKGHLFNEIVFNDSVKEFWRIKQELANYFDESQTEDIFDYIPPQKTNQIFTPKWVVQKMVDLMEEENPGCFDDPNNTFADLYMKSGLFIAEIVKRLYRSEKMKTFYPDNQERIKHILSKQVYGMAPTRIIYLIATNYILGFNEEIQSSSTHFVQADAAEAAKKGKMVELVNQYFGQI